MSGKGSTRCHLSWPGPSMESHGWLTRPAYACVQSGIKQKGSQCDVNAGSPARRCSLRWGSVQAWK
eukprot:2143537-Amphidinium_carterae.1